MRVSFIRVLIPFMWAPPSEPNHPKRLHLLIPSYWRLEFKHMYFWEHKHSVYSSVFFLIGGYLLYKFVGFFCCITMRISHCCCSITKSCPTVCDPTEYNTPDSSVLHCLWEFAQIIRIFFSESTFCIRWPKYWSFSFSISPSSEYSGLISFKIHWFDLLAVQGNQP